MNSSRSLVIEMRSEPSDVQSDGSKVRSTVREPHCTTPTRNPAKTHIDRSIYII
ncbi:hypothetical protein RHMOL_Rhmol09G0042500 [Rhododendron molle]|uniref:Uncharacterized protein n=1 Tax=Rhododendron molle TaxID=49168 RepID=A0ACC0M9Z4_RHOML|nr:hypothetical protein RHMOL_Rhmol09G0042500 [Rhododendron molle]